MIKKKSNFCPTLCVAKKLQKICSLSVAMNEKSGCSGFGQKSCTSKSKRRVVGPVNNFVLRVKGQNGGHGAKDFFLDCFHVVVAIGHHTRRQIISAAQIT